ncbi:MAG: TonB-dependent receptor [Gemmatimonadales bacterium]|nr:TonB-dependent receptor [Gemmatimonadales bacterium]
MQPIGRAVRFGAAVVATLLVGVETLAAQGLTSAAVQGRVTTETRGTVENGIVILTNTRNGARQQTTTNSAGRYNFENATPGGPYTIEVRAIGFQPATKTGIMLSLGQRYQQDFEMKQQVVTLEELTVIAATNPLINSGRTGAAQIVGDTAIQRLPLLGRNFTDLLRTSPQVLSGSSIAGQNVRFNNIQIDGGANNDVFAISTSAAVTPGNATGAKPISLEAIQEFQILVAPFDIRQGSFSGGLINGITKSGGNDFHGSVFGYMQRPDLVGKDTSGTRITNFSIKQYGGTISGPIIRNKLHFFGSADLQSSGTQFFGLSAAEPATGVSVATARRVQSIIKDNYGFDPGDETAPENLQRPDKNLFGKLTYQVGNSSQLEVSYNYVKASTESFNRTFRTSATQDGWQLSLSGNQQKSTTNSARAKFTSLVGGANLEVLLGYLRVRDRRPPNIERPLLMVLSDRSIPAYIGAGGERFSHGNELDQDIYEATANLTFGLGRNHQITVGTHNEFFSFRNLFAQNRFGTWTFGSPDSLEAGLARQYQILLELRPGGFTADFGVKQLGGYIQDAWRPNDRLTLTAGLRFDVPVFNDTPVENTTTPEVVDTFGVHTGDFPSGNMLLSPRLGFNWDPFGNGNTVVRGGVGIFSGRPPYVWMSNAFTGTGREQQTLSCTVAGTIPAFTPEVADQPKSCVGLDVPAPPTSEIRYFEKDFKFQQTLKYALGVDHRLPGGLVATADFLLSKSRNQMYFTDDNVRLGEINGEGRQLYSNPTAAVSPANTTSRLIKSNKVRQVIHHLNKNADKSTLLTFQLQKSFESGLSFSGSYTWSKTEDLLSLTSSQASSNLQNTPLVGTLDNRELGLSGFDVPHKFALSGSANLPFGLQASMIFTARAGTPYAYVYTNDANGDGISTNDLVYVPRDANDITLQVPADWAKLDTFIESEPCLSEQRGRIMTRGSCRNPWQKIVDLRLAKGIKLVGGQSFLVTADIFNLANLLDPDWGLVRETSFFQQVSFLTMVNTGATQYDTRGTATQSDDRGIYTVPSVMPPRNRVITTGISRWKIQLGGKYIF